MTIYFILYPGTDFNLMHRRILATSSTELGNEVYSKFQQYYAEHD